jgi:hypothetical protein
LPEGTEGETEWESRRNREGIERSEGNATSERRRAATTRAVRRRSPAGEKLTLKRFLSFPHLLLSPEGDDLTTREGSS